KLRAPRGRLSTDFRGFCGIHARLFVFSAKIGQCCRQYPHRTDGRQMLTRRHGAILKLLEARGALAVGTLSQELGVSTETVRRDIGALVEAGAAVRVHGAVGLAGQIGEAPFERRMRENAAAKRAIARAMAERIGDGDSLMLDTGTTTSFLARALLDRRRMTVV